ncbi:MAG: DUF4214 domain-containing protein [Pseudomonadota bacterium]
MALTQEQIDILASGGDIDFGLPTNPGPSSADGIFFNNVSFQTDTGNQDDTPQGESAITVTNDFNGGTGPDASLVVRNADLTVADDFGTFRSEGAVYAISGPDASLAITGRAGDNSSIRLATFDGLSTLATYFVSDGAQVTVDHFEADRRGSIDIGVNWGPFTNDDGSVTPSGGSVDGTLVIEGSGTSVRVQQSAGGDRGSMNVGRVDPAEGGLEDTTPNRNADGLVIVRDGSDVSIHQFVGLGDANNVSGATANGTLIVEGAGTSMTVGDPNRTVSDGFMRVAAEGGTGTFILRDGAEFNLLAGNQFGGGLQLSGGSTQDGGDATALVTGAGTLLFVEEGNISVGRNGGTASFTISDQATVETRSFDVGRNSMAEALVTGEGTSLSMVDGEEGSLNIGFVRDGSTPENLDAQGTMTISNGADVTVREFVGVGDANAVEGATATGTLIVEGAGTTVTVGAEGGTGPNGFMRIADEGGAGSFVLRDGAEFQLLAGEEFGGGINLSGAGDRTGGEASAIITGAGTKLSLDKGNIDVGRNGGDSTFTASDGATVEALFFLSGGAGVGDTVFEGEGTSLTLSGEQVTPEFGAFLTVGRDTSGTFTVRDGADVNIIGAGDTSTFPGFQIGRNDGGEGVLTVSGAGSTITIDGSAITPGTNGENGFIRAGRDNGSDGTINILAGGVITNDPNGNFSLAREVGATGRLNVDGAGSLFDFGARGAIALERDGGQGVGVATISNGGVLRGTDILNNGVLDITSGGMLEANLEQDGILRSSSGVETAMIDGNLTLNGTGSFVVDVSTDGARGIAHDTYVVTGDAVLNGTMNIVAPDIAALRGLTLDVISAESVTIGDGFNLNFVEFDGNAVEDVTTVSGPMTGITFTSNGSSILVDFGTDNSQTGTDGGETLAGTALSDALDGQAGDDTLNGEAGNDRVTGGGGNDALNGGDGIDTAFYSGAQTSYTLALSATGATLTDRRADQNGTDTLSGIEFLDFDTDVLGMPFDLNTFAGAASLTEADFESFIELYIAYFNRAPDAVGLNFWGTAFATGTTLPEIAALFIDQDETRALYPEDLNNEAFLSAVYNNVLGREGDQAGFDFWLGVLNDASSGVGRDQFILEVLKGARADPGQDADQAFIDQQLADQQYLENKTDIGAYYAVINGLSDVANATQAMALFNGSQESIASAVSAIDGFGQAALDAETGEFLMPLVGVLEDPFAMG